MSPDPTAGARAVRDELARLQRDPAWLARAADVDQGTVGDFLAGNRAPRLSTMAKIEAALGWEPGTIDRLNRGADPSPSAGGRFDAGGPMEAAGARAMLAAIEGELAGATQAWTDAVMRLQEAQIAAKAAEDRRALLVLDHARLTQRLEQLRAAEEGGAREGERPTR